MKVLSLGLFAVLATIAALHAYWAFGGLWPAGSERRLIDTVIGDANMAQMPSMMATLMVAALIFAAALIALAAGESLSPAPARLARLAATGMGLVFFARGVGGYFFERFAWNPVEPFVKLNAWFYSPLCLAIGAAFLILALSPAVSKRGI